MLTGRNIGVVLASLATMVSTLQAQANRVEVKLPLRQGSVRFAVIGDSGTGDKDQYEVAKEMEGYRAAVKYDFVIMLGDNIYGGHGPEDFTRKFELPYKPLLDAGVKFYASLGNHDDPNIEHGPDLDLRNQLSPLLKLYGVNSVFSGHEHAYERIKPQDGIYYFIQGDSGKLVHHDFRRRDVMETSFDKDCTFMLVEVNGDELFYQTVSRSGETVDSGKITRQREPARAAVGGR